MNASRSILDAVVLHYGDPVAEAVACRRSCALFDFSFLATAEVSGPGAAAALGHFSGRDVGALPVGRICYGVRRHPDATLAADLTVWRFSDDTFWLMSGRHRDVLELTEQSFDLDCRDLTAEQAVFAIQGPDSARLIASVSGSDAVLQLAYFSHTRACVFDIPCVLGRLGYTGEIGFEIVVAQQHASELWRRLSKLTVRVGFAAANILRIEAGFLLFTHEFRVPVTASEVGFSKLLDAHTESPRVRLCCFTARSGECPDFWEPSSGLSLPEDASTICITSAAFSPLAGSILGLGYIHSNSQSRCASPVDATGEFRDIDIAPLPFYDPKKNVPRQRLVSS